MTTSFSNAAPSSIVRVLDFMRRADHHALLGADMEVLEAVAVHTVLSFVGYVRAAVRKKRGTCWLPRDFAFDRSCTDAVAYTVARRVVPRQLMEDGAAPLRRLLLEAVQPATVVYVPCSGSSALQPWCEWLGQLLGVKPSDLCCTRVVLQADGVEAAAELRFQHGRFPSVAGLEEVPNGAKNGEAGAYAAALAGHHDCLRFLKDTGSNLLKLTTHRFTAVHAAVYNERTDCLNFLLRKFTFSDEAISATVLLAAEKGSAASLRVFHSAEIALFGVDPRFGRQHAVFPVVAFNHAPALDFLLSALKPEDILSRRRDGQFVATLAASLGHVECLQVLHRCDSGCLAASYGKLGTLPSIAASKGQLAVLRYLRDVGASVTLTPDTAVGYTAAVHAAARSGSLDCLQFLLDVEDPSVRESDAFGTSVACAACQGCDVRSLQLLIRNGCRIIAPHVPGRCTAVRAAVAAGAVDCFRFLASQGANLAATDANKESMAFDAVRHRQPATLALLIEHGGRGVLAANARGQTPLHEAARIGAVECVPLLVGQGILDAVDSTGWTAAQVAAVEDQLEVLRALCAAGADLRIKDMRGFTTRSLAIGNCRNFLNALPNQTKSTLSGI